MAEGHAEAFGAFDRWARRIAASDTTFASRATLHEAAFAPLRGSEAVLAAWIERRGPDPQMLAHPPRASLPASLAWRRVRAPGLGEVEVAIDERREYVRRVSPAPGGATLLVTVAFARTAGSASGETSAGR